MIKRRVSVRELAETAARSGDIDARLGGGVSNLAEGSRLHRVLQKGAGENYRAEVFLKITAVVEDVLFTVAGRADGVITDGDNVTIDEIKTTLRRVDGDRPAHWAQVMCYAHIYAETFDADRVSTRLTYYHIPSAEVTSYTRTHTRAELASHFLTVLGKCVRWARLDDEWARVSRESMAGLPFPFEKFRDGQRKFAGAVYKAARDGFDLFAAAPTGTGKTVSALYPAVRALGEEFAEKVFYMTAKETGRRTARDAVTAMADAGLRARTVFLTAKDKICPLETRACYPEACERARGHYDRADDALYKSLRDNDLFDQEQISALAEAHCVCPFEFALDLAARADIIVCDYNYVFDPKAYLRRFFADAAEGRFIFLADEAHNLPDRARDMFSCEITKRMFLDARTAAPKRSGVRKSLTEINKYFLEISREPPGETVSDKRPENIDKLLDAFTSEVSAMLERGEDAPEPLLEAFWGALDYRRVSDAFNGDDYATITRAGSPADLSGRFAAGHSAHDSRDANAPPAPRVSGTRGKSDVTIKLYCADPSKELGARLAPARAAVFFSATLYPFDFYRAVLGEREGAKSLSLLSPFPRGNFLPVIAGNISTRYRSRTATMESVARLIATHAGVFSDASRNSPDGLSRNATLGNCIAFFPSYEYLRGAYDTFSGLYPGVAAFCQEPRMDTDARDAFLRRFDEPGDGFVAFCVLGGVFAEGVDLKGDRVSGVVIVGVGLPGLCAETEILRARFGYDYAYTYPGFNRVLQAAGRLIRAEDDRGAALLIDDRFTRAPYPALFPEHWAHRIYVRGAEDLRAALRGFWG